MNFPQVSVSPDDVQAQQEQLWSALEVRTQAEQVRGQRDIFEVLACTCPDSGFLLRRVCVAVNLAAALDARDACMEAETAVQAAYAARDAYLVELRDSGLSVRDVAELMGVSAARVSQIHRAHAQRVWGPVPCPTAAERLALAREAFALAKHAQDLRCEAYTNGWESERAVFYGEPDAPQSDSAEQRITWKGWHVGQVAETAAQA